MERENAERDKSNKRPHKQRKRERTLHPTRPERRYKTKNKRGRGLNRATEEKINSSERVGIKAKQSKQKQKREIVRGEGSGGRRAVLQQALMPDPIGAPINDVGGGSGGRAFRKRSLPCAPPFSPRAVRKSRRPPQEERPRPPCWLFFSRVVWGALPQSRGRGKKGARGAREGRDEKRMPWLRARTTDGAAVDLVAHGASLHNDDPSQVWESRTNQLRPVILETFTVSDFFRRPI